MANLDDIKGRYKLAELWEEQRALYEVSCSVYHDRVIRDNILQWIAEELLLSGEHVYLVDIYC